MSINLDIRASALVLAAIKKSIQTEFAGAIKLEIEAMVKEAEERLKKELLQKSVEIIGRVAIKVTPDIELIFTERPNLMGRDVNIVVSLREPLQNEKENDGTL